jgi:hypothetical protein
VALEIVGELSSPLDAIVKEALHHALDRRSGDFVVQISQPYAELIVHVKAPFDRTLKFNPVSALEVGRELHDTLTAIVDEELSSA